MQQILFLAEKLERALLSVDRVQVEKIMNEALALGPAIEVASSLVTLVLQRIGESWESGDVSLSQIYLSGVICEELIDRVLPPASPLRRQQPKMAIAVLDDYHLLGKRIVFSTLRASGYELMDFGGGLQVDELVRLVHENKIRILLISVLMLPSALHIKDLKLKLADTNVTIVVGGAPFRFDPDLWKEVGADATARDSAEAAMVISRLMDEISSRSEL